MSDSVITRNVFGCIPTNYSISGPGLYTVGKLNIWSWNTDQGVLAPSIVSNMPLPAATAQLTTPTRSFSKQRLIGFGFEIVNTTAVINKQGLLTCYRTPRTESCSSMIGFDGVGAGNQANFNINVMPQTTSYYDTMQTPPCSVSEAMTYPGTVQLPAADGAYVVGRFDPMATPLRQGSYGYLALLPTNVSTNAYVTGGINIGALYTSSNANDIPGEQELPMYQQYVNPDTMEQSGVMLTGLGPTSTFTINVRAYYEIAPRIEDPNTYSLVPCTSTSPDHDPKAIALYKAIAESMPPAVPQTMNPMGEWWDRIVNVAKSVVGNPVFRGALTAVLPEASAALAAYDVVAPYLDSRGSTSQQAVVKQKKKKKRTRVGENRPRSRANSASRRPSFASRVRQSRK